MSADESVTQDLMFAGSHTEVKASRDRVISARDDRR